MASPKDVGDGVVFFGVDAMVGVTAEALRPVSPAAAGHWEAAAKADAEKDWPAATLARLRALEASGEPTSPPLRSRGLLRYVPTVPFGSPGVAPGRLQPLGRGYLFSGAELA